MTEVARRPSLPPELDPRRVSAPGRRVPPRPRRLLAVLACVVSAVILLTSTGLYLAYRHYAGQVSVLPGTTTVGAAPAGSRGENYLVVGSDSGDGLTDAQLREVGASRVGRTGVRTDTIILVHLPTNGKAARFVSFPRDALVAIPGHGTNKLNAAYPLGERERAGGGPAKLLATVSELTGQHIDHYVQVSMFGFYTITNAVGGVDVCLSRPVKEWHAHIDLPAGRQTLRGKDALAFVRQRYGVPGGDLGRIRRQQYFLGALTRKVQSPGVLFNPFRLNALLTAAGRSVQVDAGTSGKDLFDLARRVRSVAAGKVAFQTVPVAGDARRSLPGQPNASVVLLDEAALPGFFASLDQAPGGRSPATSTVTLPPSSVAVTVENGTQRAGLAREVGKAMAATGFRVRAVRTAARTDHADTVVSYGGDRAAAARTALAALPGAVARPDPALARSAVVVTVGSRYRGVNKVVVPAAGSRTSPRVSTAAEKGCIA